MQQHCRHAPPAGPGAAPRAAVGRPAKRPRLALQAVAAPIRETGAVRPDPAAEPAAPDALREAQPQLLLRHPEDFSVPHGQLSSVVASPAPQQPFRCLGCTRQECQVRMGDSCAWQLLC